MFLLHPSGYLNRKQTTRVSSEIMVFKFIEFLISISSIKAACIRNSVKWCVYAASPFFFRLPGLFFRAGNHFRFRLNTGR